MTEGRGLQGCLRKKFLYIEEVIAKQKEIAELRIYYQAGIEAEKQTIMDAVGSREKGALSFKAAMVDPRIRLGLEAILRRDTYIKKLAVPSQALFAISEELLFMERRAGVLMLMVGRTSDIDVDGFKSKVTKKGNDINIRIGDKDKYVSGDVTYRIHYKVLGAMNFFEDHSEFYRAGSIR